MPCKRGGGGVCHTGPRMPLDIHSSLKDVRCSFKNIHSWTFMAKAKAWAKARATVRTRARARFNFGNPLRSRDVLWCPWTTLVFA